MEMPTVLADHRQPQPLIDRGSALRAMKGGHGRLRKFLQHWIAEHTHILLARRCNPDRGKPGVAPDRHATGLSRQGRQQRRRRETAPGRGQKHHVYDRGGIVDRSRATLAFAPDGRIVGRASCNDYAGRWTLDGESLRIAGLATASRTCAPALMRQEARLVERLHAVRRFAIAPDGALVLHDDRDGRIVARR